MLVQEVPMKRRSFLRYTGCAAAGALGLSALPSCTTALKSKAVHAQADKDRLPNIILIFADDLGYGDLSVNGHPTIHTKHLDQLASEGAKLTQFYSAAPVCTPSRAALMTGRLPVRTGMCSDKRRVLFPDSLGGLPDSEVTIAEGLKSKGYATACIGKWHLGHLPQYLPTKRGFDSYFGIPYSNDMRPTPLLENEKVIEEPAEQTTLTRRYTEKAKAFIKTNKDRPFFLYFPHTFPHVPLFASKDFKGTSLRGLYGDVVQELDWSVGQITKTVKGLGLAENTLIVFTSDNGPWLTQWLKTKGGSAGLLRGGKGSTWEGGMREPCIAWWPGKISAGTINPAVSSTLDLLPTCFSLAGITPPTDRVMDGYNLLPALLENKPSPRNVMFFYRGVQLMAVRMGPWKAHFMTEPGYNGKRRKHSPPLLFHLEHDPSEKYNIADKHPDVINKIMKVAETHASTLKPVENQLEKRKPKKKT